MFMCVLRGGPADEEKTASASEEGKGLQNRPCVSPLQLPCLTAAIKGLIRKMLENYQNGQPAQKGIERDVCLWFLSFSLPLSLSLTPSLSPLSLSLFPSPFFRAVVYCLMNMYTGAKLEASGCFFYWR